MVITVNRQKGHSDGASKYFWKIFHNKTNGKIMMKTILVPKKPSLKWSKTNAAPDQ